MYKGMKLIFPAPEGILFSLRIVFYALQLTRVLKAKTIPVLENFFLNVPTNFSSTDVFTTIINYLINVIS